MRKPVTLQSPRQRDGVALQVAPGWVARWLLETLTDSQPRPERSIPFTVIPAA